LVPDTKFCEGEWSEGTLIDGLVRYEDTTLYKVRTHPQRLITDLHCYSDGEQPSNRGAFNHQGSFRDGKFHGYGRKLFACGCSYEGAWANGEPHGRGSIGFSLFLFQNLRKNRLKQSPAMNSSLINQLQHFCRVCRSACVLDGFIQWTVVTRPNARDR
jgi:hypothetical protein